MNLKEKAEAARSLANELFNDEETRCTQSKRCMQSEEERPLTKAEKLQGWARRPFNAYDAERMCAGCRAYFFQEMAAQTLHEMRCWQRRAEAEIERNTAKS